MTDFPPGIHGASELSAAQRVAIEALALHCRERDGLAAELHLTSASQRREGEINQFLYADGGALAGVVSLSPGTQVEALMLIHPAYRRRGVGRALLAAVRAECQRRGATEWLLVVEDRSLAGVAFAEALGGRYRFSEYCLELDPAAFSLSAPRGEPIALRRAGQGDCESLIHLCRAAFDDPEPLVRASIARWLREPDQRFFIGWRGDEAVGLIRAGCYGEIVYFATFGVLPERRGCGFGRQILEQTIHGLLSEGRTLRIEVETQNDNALSLYRSCGFQPCLAYRYYELPLTETR